MSDLEKSKEELVEELSALRHEAAELRTARAILDVQSELLRTLETTVKTGSRSLVLKTLLQDAIKIFHRLVEPEESSFFLLDEREAIAESVLARGATIRQQKENLIGRVLSKGLAGWVNQHRQMGIIEDTREDDRWLILPNQPYQARSALGIPISRNRRLLGIATLTHSEPSYFTPTRIEAIEAAAEAAAAALELAWLYANLLDARDGSPAATPEPRSQSPKRSQAPKTPSPVLPTPPPATPPPRFPPSKPPAIAVRPQTGPPIENLASLGLYVIVWNGKFVYANRKLAKIFGYSFKELVRLGSFFDLVSQKDYDSFSERVYRCIRGQIKNIHCTFTGKRKDRLPLPVEFYGAGTKFYGKPAIVGTVRALERSNSAATTLPPSELHSP